MKRVTFTFILYLIFFSLTSVCLAQSPTVTPGAPNIGSGITIVGGTTLQGTFSGYNFADAASPAYFIKPADTGDSLIVAGHVGIGNTNPAETLAVSDSDPIISLQLNNVNIADLTYNGDGANLTLRNALGTTKTWVNATSVGGYISILDAAGNSDIYLDTEAGNDSYISTSGNFGIGTTLPEYLLDVNGTAEMNILSIGGTAVTATATKLNYLTSATGTTGTGALMFGTSPTITTSLIMSNGATLGQAAGPLMTFDDTGNDLEISGADVGIGTTSPDAKLDVQGGDIRIGALSSIESSGTFYLEPGTGIVGLGINQVGVLDILNGVTTKIRINSSGDSYFNGGTVGIGTTSPSALAALDVVSTLANGQIRIYNSESGENAIFLNQSSAAEGANFNISESTSPRLTIDGSGNIGIGTTAPARKFHVAGTARITTSVALTETKSLCTDATGDIELVASNDCVSSSRRNKENITDLEYGLDEINKLNPVFYNFKTFDQGGFDGRTKRRIGFIAEDMISVIPEVVLVDESGLPETLDYSELVPLLAKGIQEQQVQIENLQKQVDTQKNEISELNAAVEELKK